MKKTGKRPHDSYHELNFELRKDSESQKNVAHCLVCESDLKNTAIARLQAHRRVCISKTANQTLSEEIENSDTVKNQNPTESGSSHKRKVRSQDDFDDSVCSSTSKDQLINQNSNECTVADNLQPTTKKDTITPTLHKTTAEEKKVECKNPRKKNATLKSFVDKLDPLESQTINNAMVEYILTSNLSFDTVKSLYFKKFINLLRPAYILLTELELNKAFFNVYKNHTDTKIKFESVGILIISHQKDAEKVISMTFNEEGKFLFIKADKTPDDITHFIDQSISLVKQKCDVKIYAVVSNTTHTVESNDNYWYFTCMFEKLKSLIDFLISETCVSNVSLLYSNFQKPLMDAGKKLIPLDKMNVMSYYGAFSSCLDNFNFMKQLLGDNRYKFPSTVIAILFNKEFEISLDETVSLLKYIHENMKKERLYYTRAEALEDWMKLSKMAKSIDNQVIIEEFLKDFCSPVIIAANYLHPYYRGKNSKLDVDVDQELMTFLINIELEEEGLSSFFNYKNNSDIFQLLSKTNYSSLTFWKSVGEKHKILSQLALKLLRIPAYTNTKIIQSFNSLNFSDEIENTALELYYLLKINE